MELTGIEVKFLILLFNIGSRIIETQDGHYEINNDSFSRDDLYNLACKFGIQNLYY